MQRAVIGLITLALVFGLGVVTGRVTARQAEQAPRVDPDAPAVRPGDRQDPIAVGDAADVGSWTVRVEAFVAEGTAEVLASNQFNVAPPAGSTYALVDVRLTRRAPGPGVVRGALMPAMVTPGNVEYPLTGDCGVIEAALEVQRLVAQGEDLFGRWCWNLPVGETDKVTMRLAGTGGGAVWFRLH